ncbi:MAG: PAS domain-containing sensor histidine kinase [Rhodobacterales bacterium]|nr:MAG: PAS domain-containing sensor histidine kinase [Rhodobacterales bacterium]
MSFQTLWNALPMPAFLITEQGQIGAVNDAGEGFVVASARTLIGRRCVEVLDVGVDLERAFARVRADNSPMLIKDVDVASRNRPPGRCNIRIAPMSLSDPRLLLLLSPREVSQQVRPAGAPKSAIGMAEMLAHEIKNPLAGITGAAQLLAMNLPKADQEMTDLIVSEARRVVALLDQVEQFGDVSPPDCRAFNIHDVLERACQSARLGFAAHMQIKVDYDPSLPDVWGDPDQLMQVVLNLLKNASQAGAEGGTIRIRSAFQHDMRLSRSDGSRQHLPILLEISDNGPGIPPDIAADIFDPFVSGRENGTGLGLALVSKIISDHQGWITVDTQPGRTAFRISLPVSPAAKGGG